MLTGPLVFSTGLLESVARTVRFAVPAVVGVPLTTQPAPIDSPAGNVPDVTEQLYGPVPPLTPTVALYATATWPFGSEATVIASGAGAIVRLTGPLVVAVGLAESVAFTVRFAVPATVGVPLTTQPPPSESPAGSVPEVIVQV
jgi:hypothetical protein